jgi:hypothetical protein
MKQLYTCGFQRFWVILHRVTWNICYDKQACILINVNVYRLVAATGQRQFARHIKLSDRKWQLTANALQSHCWVPLKGTCRSGNGLCLPGTWHTVSWLVIHWSKAKSRTSIYMFIYMRVEVREWGMLFPSHSDTLLLCNYWFLKLLITKQPMGALQNSNIF